MIIKINDKQRQVLIADKIRRLNLTLDVLSIEYDDLIYFLATDETIYGEDREWRPTLPDDIVSWKSQQAKWKEIYEQATK